MALKPRTLVPMASTITTRPPRVKIQTERFVVLLTKIFGMHEMEML
jgi:hypothetical protein